MILIKLSKNLKNYSIMFGVTLQKLSAYRKIPTAKKIAGEDFTIVSSSDKEIYNDIDKARKNELLF